MPIQLRFVSPISLQPSDINAVVGEQVAFIVGVNDPNKVLGYQWQVSTNEGLTYSDIVGETESTLILIATYNLHNNRYRAIVRFKQENIETIHRASALIEVNNIYTDGAILSIIGYVYPSSTEFSEFIIP